MQMDRKTTQAARLEPWLENWALSGPVSPRRSILRSELPPSRPRLEFWPFFGSFRVQKIIFSFRKIFSQYSVPYRNRSPWNSEHSTSSTVPHRITHRQTHGITTKAYSFNDVKYTVFSIYLIRNHEQEHIANITYLPPLYILWDQKQNWEFQPWCRPQPLIPRASGRRAPQVRCKLNA